MTDPDANGIGPRGEADPDRPSMARMYDYLLGGKDNYDVDKQQAEKAKRAYPGIDEAARINRMALHRMARYLAEQTDIRQFIDIGTGIPTEPNFHQIIRHSKPDARFLYTDFDKTVLRHVEGLVEDDPEQRIAYIHADVREPHKIIKAARAHLDFDEPIALSLVAILHFIKEAENPYDIVRTLTDPLVPGSALAVTQVTGDFDAEAGEGLVKVYGEDGLQARLRSHAEVGRFFDGFELVPPGLVVAPKWHPELAVPTPWPPPEGSDRTPVYAGLARKP